MSLAENFDRNSENQQRRTRRWRITTLVAVHVFTSGFIPFRNEISEAVGSTHLATLQVSLFHCQVGLLGIWGGLGTNRWPSRLLGVGAAITYLSSLIAISLRPHFSGTGYPENSATLSDVVKIIVTVVVAPAMLVALMSLIVRRTIAQLRVDHEDAAVENAPRLQFSIRHLMLVTLLVSITMPVGIGIWRDLEFNRDGLRTGATIFILAWMTTWAALAKRAAYIPIFLTLGFTTIVGLGIDYSKGNSGFPYATAAMVSTYVFSLASLLVVRGCGYRVVRIKYAIAPADMKRE
jgi:hypothetical protein